MNALIPNDNPRERKRGPGSPVQAVRVEDWDPDDLGVDWCDEEKERLLLHRADAWIASREQAYRERALASGNIWHLIGFQREASR